MRVRHLVAAMAVALLLIGCGQGGARSTETSRTQDSTREVERQTVDVIVDKADWYSQNPPLARVTGHIANHGAATFGIVEIALTFLDASDHPIRRMDVYPVNVGGPDAMAKAVLKAGESRAFENRVAVPPDWSTKVRATVVAVHDAPNVEGRE